MLTPPLLQERNGLHSAECSDTRDPQGQKEKMFKFSNPHTNPIAGAPMPISYEGRAAMSIAWYATEAEAQTAAAIVAARGSTYEGGRFDGMACGRSEGYDKKTNGVKVAFAVTY